MNTNQNRPDNKATNNNIPDIVATIRMSKDHLSPDTWDAIWDNTAFDKWNVVIESIGEDHFMGTLLFVPDKKINIGYEEPLPEELRKIIDFAWANNIEFILLRDDGDIIKGLPLFTEN